MRKLPVGIQSFEKLITDSFVYVDKTEYVYRLSHQNNLYFLSRPRRFGKSLLLSTFKAYWEGKRELFRGLKIEELEKGNPDAWKAYPVFCFDFNGENYQNKAAIENIIDEQLKGWEREYAVSETFGTIGHRFRRLLAHASRESGLRCVVLVDEYDKPLLDSMGNPELQEHNRTVFKSFFSSLKGCDELIQFVMITGVTKFEKVSIFSDLNNLEDISLDEEFACICGITESELRKHFSREVDEMAAARSISAGECLERLEKTYDGYRFSSLTDRRVYNPYSLLTALKKRKFGAYWFETGTPSFLMKSIRSMHFDVRQFSDGRIYVTERTLSDYRMTEEKQSVNADLVPLLYQTGYLTIIEYDQEEEYYTLGMPNEEVKNAFMEELFPEYVGDNGAGSGKDILTLRRYLEEGDTEKIHVLFCALFAGIPYTTNDAPFEHYFQTVIYLVFTLLDQFVHCEMHTSQGRIDCITVTKRFIYIFEFKRDESADAALRQIEKRGYALPFMADPRTIFKIGVNFDSGSRMLTEWKVEKGSR